MAVVLSVFTAVYLIGMEPGNEGAPAGAQTISDADTVCYTNDMITGDMIYITSATVMDNAFKDCTDIARVYTKKTTEIGAHAFEGCTNLSYFEAKYLTAIGDHAFKDTSLSNVVFTNRLTTIGDHAFEGCTTMDEPFLTGTGVTELGEGVFKNSAVKIEDLRNITSMHETAFEGCDLMGQIINDGQTVKLSGVTEITVKDVDVKAVLTSITSEGCTLAIGLPSNLAITLSCKDYRGVTEYRAGSLPYLEASYGCMVPFFGSELRIEPRATIIHFAAEAGLEDVVHKSGQGTYTVPSLPYGDLLEKWVLDGGDEPVQTITDQEFQDLDIRITLTPVFTTRTVTYDHSQISSKVDTSSLAQSKTFSIGDQYDSMSDVFGFTFSGWNVNGSFVSPGSAITTYSDHTAVSVWNAITCEVQIYGAAGTVVQTLTVPQGDSLDLSSLTIEVPEDKVFKGWGLTSGGALLVSNPRIDSDASLYPVLENKPTFTLRYIDGDSVLGSVSSYSGSTVTIEQPNPQCIGKIFQNWKLAGSETRFYREDSVVLDSDKTLEAVWKAEEVTLSYHHVFVENRTYGWGDNVPVGTANAVRSDYELLGWSYSSGGPVEVADGSSLLLQGNVDLYAVWKNVSKHTMTLNHFDGQTTKTQLTFGDTYVLPGGHAREQSTFLGWSLSDGGSVNYVEGDSLTVSIDMDLYEVWEVHVPIAPPEEQPAEEPEAEPLPDTTQPDATQEPEPSEITEPQPAEEPPAEDAIPPETEDVIQEPEPADDTGTEPAEEPSETDQTPAPMEEKVQEPEPAEVSDPQPIVEPPAEEDAPTEIEDYVPPTTTVDQPEDIGPSDTEGEVIQEPIADATDKGAPDAPPQEQPAVAETPADMPKDDTENVPTEQSPREEIAPSVYYQLKLIDGAYTVLTTWIEDGREYHLSDAPRPYKSGYLFKGWSRDGTEDRIVYRSENVTMDSDITLYSVWDRLLKLTYHDGGESNILYYEREEDARLDTPSKEGFEFVGWKDATTGMILNGHITMERDLILYAVWEQIAVETVPDEPVKDAEGEVPDAVPSVADEPEKETAGSDAEKTDASPSEPSPVQTDKEDAAVSEPLPVAAEPDKASSGTRDITPSVAEEDASGTGFSEVTPYAAAGVIAAIVSAVIIMQVRRN
jgi:hypothetical protein